MDDDPRTKLSPRGQLTPQVGGDLGPEHPVRLVPGKRPPGPPDDEDIAVERHPDHHRDGVKIRIHTPRDAPLGARGAIGLALVDEGVD